MMEPRHQTGSAAGQACCRLRPDKRAESLGWRVGSEKSTTELSYVFVLTFAGDAPPSMAQTWLGGRGLGRGFSCWGMDSQR